MKPQYTKGKLVVDHIKETDEVYITLEVNGNPIRPIAQLVSKKDKPHFDLICSSVNIIQSLADSLGVNAVELAQRMEEGNTLIKLNEKLQDLSVMFSKFDPADEALIEIWEGIDSLIHDLTDK